MPDKYKCDRCEKTFNEPLKKEHRQKVIDIYKLMTGTAIMAASGIADEPEEHFWIELCCPYCDSSRLSEWFEGYINWEDFF